MSSFPFAFFAPPSPPPKPVFPILCSSSCTLLQFFDSGHEPPRSHVFSSCVAPALPQRMGPSFLLSSFVPSHGETVFQIGALLGVCSYSVPFFMFNVLLLGPLSEVFFKRFRWFSFSYSRLYMELRFFHIFSFSASSKWETIWSPFSPGLFF